MCLRSSRSRPSTLSPTVSMPSRDWRAARNYGAGPVGLQRSTRSGLLVSHGQLEPVAPLLPARQSANAEVRLQPERRAARRADNKDKLFYFVSYEGSTDRRFASRSITFHRRRCEPAISAHPARRSMIRQQEIPTARAGLPFPGTESPTIVSIRSHATPERFGAVAQCHAANAADEQLLRGRAFLSIAVR